MKEKELVKLIKKLSRESIDKGDWKTHSLPRKKRKKRNKHGVRDIQEGLNKYYNGEEDE